MAVEIKKGKIDSLVAAIQALDEPVTISVDYDKEGKERKTVKKILLDGFTTYRFSRNLGLLKAEQATINDARQKLFQQRDTEGEGSVKGKAAVEFQRELKALLDEPVEIPLIPIDIADLKMTGESRNYIPMDALSELMSVVIVGEIKG